jgi:glycosyltransferase involved in cell wall biosynthesis
MGNPKLSVVYYAHTYFLDATLETLKSIKDFVDIHLLIELAPESKKSTIISVDNLEGFAALEPVENVLESTIYDQLKPYLINLASVHFVMHTSNGGYSIQSILTATKVGKWIHTLQPDIIHFDTISSRTIGLFPYIRKRKVFITIHDPVAHSGEHSWKKYIPKLVYYKLVNSFFFYSKFAKAQFCMYNPSIDKPKHVIKLQPYSFIKQFIDIEMEGKESIILFFGRISYYKGIDILLEAIPIVLAKYPNEQFVIAGQLSNYAINNDFLNKYASNIKLVDEYIEIEMLAKLIQCSKFVVCPYRDATQSGVLMTTMAIGKSTIASNVGAFPEYVDNEVNGLLTEPNATALSNSILNALDNNKYKELESHVNPNYSFSKANHNQNKIISAYNYAFTNSLSKQRIKKFKKTTYNEQFY